MRASLVAIVLFAAACGSKDTKARPVVSGDPVHAAAISARIPRTPGEHGPSLVAIDRTVKPNAGDVSDGTMLADVDSCASCHPDAAAQWSASAHSFASFGNPIYRVNVELMRHDLGNTTSQHCGGCHDMPLMIDGMMTSGAPIPPEDLRAHSGVTCRLCHGIKSTTKDGNGSYVWSREPIDGPSLRDPASIARHKAQVSVTSQGSELCVSCHRGFLSADMGMPVHLSGLDESGMWRNSAYTGNGMARVDKVEQKSCIDCHMEREPATSNELGAKHGTFASHRFLGGHTWMASMRGDAEHLQRLRAKLVGAASIDIASARTEASIDLRGASGSAARPTATGLATGATWHLPADGAPVTPGAKLSL
ncbi:MAG: multiheme c-type cytochrome, partial [Kofleriaceae bacterium]|nr:multiheme c-type cytochrome [Kofleriaceae bacterium]